jgi:hypothetical protein
MVVFMRRASQIYGRSSILERTWQREASAFEVRGFGVTTAKSRRPAKSAGLRYPLTSPYLLGLANSRQLLRVSLPEGSRFRFCE